MSDLIEEAAKAMAEAEHWKWALFSDEMRDEYRKLARAVFSRLDAFGYAVVPKEPTPEMVEAGLAAFTNIHDIYRAMLAAMEGKNAGP